MPADSKCSPRQIQAYLSRVSGPLLDRIDLHVEVPPVKFQEIAAERGGEPSADIRARVLAAREVQRERFRDRDHITCNARMESRDLRRHCRLNETTRGLLENAMQDFALSARAYDRILKVARTIADLRGEKDISADPICEAIQLRSLDRQIWG